MIAAAKKQLEKSKLTVTTIGEPRLAKPDPFFLPNIDNKSPCGCVLIEQDFSLTKSEFGDFIETLASSLDLNKDAISPQIVYSPQDHYGSHPGPDHGLIPKLGSSNPARILTFKPITSISSNDQYKLSPVLPLDPPGNSVVAILDSGLSPDVLKNISNPKRVLPQSNFDQRPETPGYTPGATKYRDEFWVDEKKSLHGSVIAQIVASMSPQTRILPIKVCADGDVVNGEHRDSVCNETNVIQGICYAIKEASMPLPGSPVPPKLILNLSLLL